MATPAVRLRKEINVLMSLTDYSGTPPTPDKLLDLQLERDFFLQGFLAVLQAPPVDPYTDAPNWECFYEIAGIHGLPYKVYDGSKGSGEDQWPNLSASSEPWGGYCQHGTPLFPIWHRPYVMLLETAIRKQADAIAQDTVAQLGAGLDDATKKKILDAAARVALPYWDWASNATIVLGMPPFLNDKTVKVGKYSIGFENDPQGKPDPKKKKLVRTEIDIDNPLCSYTVPLDLGTPITGGENHNPQSRPNYKVPENLLPYTPKGFSTVRSPSAAYETNVDKVNNVVMRGAAISLQKGTWQLFSVAKFDEFSTHSTYLKTIDDVVPSSYANIESVHDSVHVLVGGNGGHMAYNEVAAFDPIFFLHHCNVDRQFAMWQACYPDSWVVDPPKEGQPPANDERPKDHDGTYTEKPGTKVSSATPLTPFYKNRSEGTYLTAADVRYTTDLGYTYPDLVEPATPLALQSKFRAMYRPNGMFGYRFYAKFPRIPKHQYGMPFKIHVFLLWPGGRADPPTEKTPVTDPHFAGTIYIFTTGISSPCANCRRDDTQILATQVDLTDAMLNLNIKTSTRPILPGDVIVDPSLVQTEPNPGNLRAPVKKEDISWVALTLGNQPLANPQVGEVSISWSWEGLRKGWPGEERSGAPAGKRAKPAAKVPAKRGRKSDEAADLVPAEPEAVIGWPGETHVIWGKCI